MVKSPPASRWSREWVYVAGAIVAWSFTPLLRRLIDFRSGAFNPVQITSLVPFLALIPLLFVCLRRDRLERISPALRVLIWVWFGTFTYGFLTAAAFGNIGAATFESVQYLVPAIFGLWIAGQGLPATEAMRRLALVFLPCAGIVALYGIVQWVQPPPWDVMWVEGSHFTGADSPVPFGMRIFSTLNSPGTAADFIAMMMIFALPFLRFGRVWLWPLMAALGGALLLTLTREAWVALIVGVVVYLALSPRRMTAFPPLLAFTALLIILVSALPTLLGSGPNADVLTSRLATFTDVGHDASALARQNEISDALQQGLNNPIGVGLGNIGAAARLGSNAQSNLGNVLDSGYLARLIELGWLGFAGYVVVVVGGPFAMLAAALRGPHADGEMSTRVVAVTAIAIGVALAWGDAASDAHLGLDGLLFWLGLGLASLAANVRRSSVAAAPRAAALRRLGRSA